MNNTTADESFENVTKPDDSYLAVMILVGTVVVVLIVTLYYWKFRVVTDSSWKTSTFTPPPERDTYITSRQKLDPTIPADLEELKKLLMRRAIQAIPILLNLQNEGNSIERLYKKGMLTDDMHFKVKEVKEFVDQEFQEVQLEAEELVSGWGAHVWRQAMQFYQMIQKQAEEKNDEITKAEEQKKKAATEKKKEKEKAKKQKDKDGGGAATGGSVSLSSKAEDEPEMELDPEKRKLLEAERMAQQLLEEEERENNKNNKKLNKSKK